MLVLDLIRATKSGVMAAANLVTGHAPDNLPELTWPRVLAGLVGLALAYSKASTSRAAAATCVNERLRQESDTNPVTGEPYSTELPDCRAYELVSSGDKNDSDAMLSPLETRNHGPFENFGLVSEDGGRLMWDKEFEPYSDPNNGVHDVYEATRGPGAWSQSDALVPPGTGDSALFHIAAASGDLSTVLMSSAPVAGEGNDQLIERGPDGSYTTIVSIPHHSYGHQPFAKLSGDGSHVFFQAEASQARLAGDTHVAGMQVYEWMSTGGLHVVGVDDAHSPVSPCGAVLAGGEGVSYSDVSQNGLRVFVQSPDPSALSEAKTRNSEGRITEAELLAAFACERPSQLYVRQNGSTTVEISKAPSGVAECEPGVTECEATFVGATPGGSKVFFITSTHLTPDKGNSDRDLYEYDVETGSLKRLSVGPPGYDEADLAAPTAAAGEPGHYAIVSGDGSHVYFTAYGQLVPGAGTSAATNRANGTVNLYLYADDSISFIATVGPAEFPGTHSTHVTPAEAPLSARVAAVTPNGSDLIFDSDSQLTAYDNEGRGELYRYDAPTHKITCISCNPVFASPNGELGAVFHTSFSLTPHGPVQQFGGLSNDGDTVFFASTEELLPAAANLLSAEPDNAIYDIYEWHAGVLSLISSGTSLSSDFLLGSSPSGSDVFFLSAAQLVPQDGEHAYQIYDARTEGGFAAPATPAPCASAESCRSMVATPPTTITPATVSVSGPGNVTTVTGSESPPPLTGKARTESRSEKLTKALKACKKLKRGKRKSCEKTAHRKYALKLKPMPKN